MGEQWGEEYYRALIENAHDVITILNADGTIRYVSPSNNALSGYTQEELEGINPFGHVHPDDVPTAARLFAELLEGPGQTREIQYRIRSKSGEWRYVQAVGTNLLDHPAIRGIVLNSRDLTELKRTEEDLLTHQVELEMQNEELRLAQQKLEDSRDLYADLYDFAPLGYASLDAAGIIREINLTGAAMLGSERGNLVGRPFASHVVGEDHALFRNHLRNCREADARVVTELRLDAAGRRVIHVELVTIPGMATQDASSFFRTTISDITERKQAEVDLRDSLERESILADFIRQATVAVGLGYADGSIGFVNPAFCKLTGYTEEELRTIDWNETLTPAEWREHESAQLAELLRTRSAVNYEKEYIRKDGSRVPIELFVHPRFDQEGRLSHYFSFINDITERKRAEEQLRLASDEWRETFDSTDEMIMLLDAGFNIIKANRATTEFLGVQAEEVAGTPCYLPMHGTKEPLGDCPLDRMRLSGRHEESEIFFPDKGIWAFVSVDPVFDADGSIVRVVHIIEDITERKRTMERLEQLNRCFLSLGTDPRENVGRILRAGRDILDAYLLKYCCRGRKAQYLCSKDGISSAPLAPQEDGCGFLAAPPEEGPVFIRDLDLLPAESHHPDVARFGLRSLLAVPVSAEQDPFGSLCLFSETEREFTAEERELLVMLARAVAIEEERYRHEENLRDFIDIASHELRHPITIMKGYSLILKEQGEKVDEGTRDVILSIIDHGADRLNNLVGGLLDISRIERGRFEVRREVQSPVPLIERAVQEMGARGFSNDFTRRLSGEMGQCSLDGEKFVELMVLLLENAVKYSPSNSPIEVEAGETEQGVLVSVLDRGMGISEQDCERVFDRFFQVEDMPHHSTPGMGMGLYIAREIVGAHGGRVWCEPREGGGTAFRFVIPGGTGGGERHDG